MKHVRSHMQINFSHQLDLSKYLQMSWISDWTGQHWDIMARLGFVHIVFVFLIQSSNCVLLLERIRILGTKWSTADMSKMSWNIIAYLHFHCADWIDQVQYMSWIIFSKLHKWMVNLLKWNDFISTHIPNGRVFLQFAYLFFENELFADRPTAKHVRMASLE